MTALLENLVSIDRDVTLFLNSLHTPFTDQFWQLFTNRNLWWPLYAVLLFALFRRLEWKKALLVVLSILACVAICDQISHLVKYSVCRLRPCYDREMLSRGLHILEHRGGYYGFVSSHAANAAGIAVSACIGFRNDKRLKYRGFVAGMGIWATLVSLSRVFVGKHFFGDVLCGALVGLAIGLILGLWCRNAVRRV